MIKKLISIIVIVLALNFLVAAGGLAFLASTGKLDREKITAIRGIISGPTDVPATQPTTQPAQDPPPETPMLRLDNAVAKASGRRAGEQIEVIQTAYDARSVMIERRLREIEDQRRQLDQAKADFEAQRKKLLADEEKVTTAQAEQAKLSEDKGFQDTLALYQSMPPKKTKAIFMQMDNQIVVRYLQAMDSRQAGSILKEFKTPDELNRAQAILEKMRLADTK
ncbi:MAG: hypothetical protein H7144_09770 [Burkholderiales bacterium]|nr:hypothetical protein [Phycisphaerae bacterium]